jgi:putative ABC transport system permease protein
LIAAFKLPIDIPVAINVQMDFRVFIFATLISLATGVLFGLLPSWQATKTDLISALKDEVSFGGYRRSWMKNSLIVLQVALSLVLLIGGGLMLRALSRAQSVNLGFTPEHASEVSFDLRLQGYDDARGRELQKRLIDRVRALPGVEVAGLADMAPVDLHFTRSNVFAEGQSPQRQASTPVAMSNRATPGYFQAMNTKIIRGRDFTERDDDKSPLVVIINEACARRFWPNEDPLGKRISIGGPDSPKREVIGVVEDGKYAGLNEDPKPFVARPLWQSYSGSTIVIVRSAAEPQQLLGAVRNEVLQLDPNIPLTARTLSERMDLPLLPARVAASVLGGFGMLALALVAIGIYGVMSYAVAKRTREIGIRMALGAERGDVLKLIVSQGLTLTVIGMAIGGAAALALTQTMKALLFGISATDPYTFIGVGVLLALVAFLSCYFPARRASKVDPMIALRYE